MSMATHQALHNDDILYCIFSQLDTDRFDYRRDDPHHSERARRGALARGARVCKAFRDIALPVLWAHLHNLVPFFRLLPTCVIVQETYLGSLMVSKKCIYALSNGSVPQEKIARLRYYGALIRAVAWNNRAAFDTPGYHDYIQDPSLTQLRLLIGDVPSNPILPNLDTLSWKLTSTQEPSSLSILMSPKLKTLRIDSVYDMGEWQTFLEQLLVVSLPIAPGLEHLSINCTAYYSELRLSPEITCPISKLVLLRSLTLSFPTHETWNEIRSDIMLNTLQMLAPLQRLERLQFRPGHIVSGSMVAASSSPGDPLFPNLQQLQLHQIRCGPPTRALFEALRTPSLRRLEASFEYRNSAELKEAFATMACCFPNLQSLSSIFSYNDEGGLFEIEDDLRSPLAEVISPLLAVRSMEMLVILSEIRPRHTVGDADLNAISAAWPHLPAFAIRCHDLQRLSLSSLNMKSLNTSRALTDDEYPRTDNPLRSFKIRELYGTEGDCVRCGRALDRLFPHLNVVENVTSFTPSGSVDTTTAYAQWRSSHALRYKLFSTILAYQNARN
ncbi:hypothetical protein ONZ51_g11361 [Trametes cubensis]|uniref:F-box domain-containing protein n=1 Tax=Trametes cubensis TaxID=1111947 RepID=A0AAD7TJD8_9APHY|nr:hypothetical protein ONZ51_g11361 [Trametes cubensis]